MIYAVRNEDGRGAVAICSPPPPGETSIKASGDIVVVIDTTLSVELMLEGLLAGLIHKINAARKGAGLKITEYVTARVGTENADDLNLLNLYGKTIKKACCINDISVVLVAAGGAGVSFEASQNSQKGIQKY